MTQIDKILIKILNLPDNDLMLVPRRELKILKNLGKLVSSPHFITENQGKLLMKILNENLRNFNGISDEISESLLTPSWSRIFRPVDKTKNVKKVSFGDSGNLTVKLNEPGARAAFAARVIVAFAAPPILVVSK